MVSTNEKVQFDFNADFGDSNYKSCFARSVVVNSQFHSKSLDFKQLQKVNRIEEKSAVNNNIADHGLNGITAADSTRTRKESQPPHKNGEEMVRRLSCCSNSSGGIPVGRLSRRGSDLPVENIALQSQVDSLQWQLKQAEESREMYRAVMQQVVSFLERAHRSLDLISERQRVVQRSRSEYHVAQTTAPNSITTTTTTSTPTPPDSSNTTTDAYTAFRDFTWRRPKRQQTAPDEIPPEKLSQEAFRLLRTAQSLLNTREPTLAHFPSDLGIKDQEFLSQLAREFPSRPQRATSFSVNPQLISPSDRDVRISTAFNRKLSLQRTPVLEGRRDSFRSESSKKSDVARNLDNEYSLISSVNNDTDDSKRSSITSIPSITPIKKGDKTYFDASEKAPSPKTGSVSSAEDESGFSSMNSFQEVGLPIVNSTTIDNDSFNDLSVNSSDSNITQISVDTTSDSKNLEKAKLIWNRSNIGLPITHRRWSSTPVEVPPSDALKVLWV